MFKPLKLFGFLVGLLVLAALGASGWLAFAPPEAVRLAAAYAAETVCANVFVAHRDIDAILQTDLLALGHPVFKRMKINVDLKDGRVRARYLGLFAEGRAQYEEGRGCTHITSGEFPQRSAAPPPAAPPQRARTDALWPEGEKAKPSSNPRLLAAVNDQVLQGPGMRAVVVVHDGRIIAEAYGPGFSASTPLQGWSMTKSVTATLVGLAIKDGKLSLDQKHLFPQWEQDARANISVADLMAMSGGLKWNEEEGVVTDQGRLVFLTPDIVAYARDRPLASPPGTIFNYSSGESVLLTRLWQNAVGREAFSYPRERLFEPLGMNSAVFEADEAGTFHGEARLFANAHDWARFGEFLRLSGVWNGEPLLPAGFVEYMRSPAPASDQGHGPVYGRGQVWLGPGLEFPLPADTFMLNGHNRQTITIIPSLKLVILRMGNTREDIGFSNSGLLRAIVASGY